MIFKKCSKKVQAEIINQILVPSKKMLNIISAYIDDKGQEDEFLKKIRGRDSIIGVFLKVAALMFKIVEMEEENTQVDTISKISNSDINIIRNFLKKYDETNS
ncbi:hypothetical protein Cyrtocomes_00504 [Candidatus Cyrtobacter comes]|uniref:Uncharacterized protein n=1 Tax=Candidatus Cyrtobacter comes TaxID=675776 RepID=A0ABU5L7N2_9RICK|nr:hypothetical protein [Candidatus Cyrtobacter comes]MDZ5762134.1 hypothetical protein [Candidatus Cyrtobacter comes]